MLKKRGSITHEIYFFIFELLLIAFIFLILFQYVKAVATDTMLERYYLSRDMALLTSTLYAAPGNVQYVYDVGKYNFTYNISNNKVRITDVGRFKALTTTYYYLEDLFFKNPNWQSKQALKSILFGKQGLEINIEKETLLYLLKCPEINTKEDLKKINVVINPAHGGSDAGAQGFIYNPDGTFKTVNESVLMFKIASYFNQLAKQKKEFSVFSTRSVAKDEEAPLENRIFIIKNMNPSVVLTLTVDDTETYANNIIAYIYANKSLFDANKKPPETVIKSRKMACTILNSLLKEMKDYTVTGLSIVETNSDQILNASKDKVAVTIKIGNIQNKDGIKMLTNREKIAEALYKGIEEYYTEVKKTPTAPTTSTAFDINKFKKYRDLSKMGYLSPSQAYDLLENKILTKEGEEHAKSLGADTTRYNQKQIIEFIKQEVRTHISDKELASRNTDLKSAQAAALAYAAHESAIEHWVKDKTGRVPNKIPKPYSGRSKKGQANNVPIGVFQVSLNSEISTEEEAYIVAWDTKYNIYVGVFNVLNYFRNSCKSEIGDEAWKCATSTLFFPRSKTQQKEFWAKAETYYKKFKVA